MPNRILTNPLHITAFQSFTRPDNATAYAVGDLIANSTTAASVAPLTWEIPEYSAKLRRARLTKDDLDATNASFRLNLFSSDPTTTAPTNGDNGAFSLHANIPLESYIGSFVFDMTATGVQIFAAGNAAVGVPLFGDFIAVRSRYVYGLLEARAAYTPTNEEIFAAALEMEIG